eukprot:Em0018g988a
MAEEVTSTATKISLFSALIPHPGINIVKTWQGIVEIVLRGVVAVLAFILIIAAATTQTQALNGRTYSAAGWLLFVAVVALLIEVAIVAIRFLNLGLIEKYTLPLVITDGAICLGVALGLFAGATAIAVYASTYNSSPAGATAAFGFFMMIAVIALGAWIMVAYFVLKWCTKGKYVVTQKSADPEPSKPM